MYAESDLINKLSELDKEKQVLFGLLGAERFFICYKVFNQREEFGNVLHLLDAMNLIERIVLRERFVVEEIDKYKNLVEENTPDMDDFGSVNSSLALNVTSIIYETLNIINDNEKSILRSISTFCTDSIDFLVSEIENYDRMDLDKVMNHSLMKEELHIQNGFINYLEKIGGVEAIDIDFLRKMQSETEFSRLNLHEIFAD